MMRRKMKEWEMEMEREEGKMGGGFCGGDEELIGDSLLVFSCHDIWTRSATPMAWRCSVYKAFSQNPTR